MGSSPAAFPSLASDAFIALFRAHAGPHETMPFAEFMRLALYAPEIGFYTRPKTRVGYGADTDFYTATSSGPIFGELVVAACVQLLGPAADLSRTTFVEIGSETPEGILKGVPHPFGATRTVRFGEPLDLRGSCVVFSNELFDAQPFRRFARSDAAWRERWVRRVDRTFEEFDGPSVEEPWLPAEAPDGAIFDAPRAAAALAARLAQEPWTGLLIAFDYGKSWRELAEATPAGTARAYRGHTQSNALLAAPGEQDLTCHVCWDWLQEAVVAEGFVEAAVESQEAFFIRHAGEFMARTMAAEANRLSRRKLSLMQLVHPSHLGQKFQVLHASRASCKITLASQNSRPLLQPL